MLEIFLSQAVAFKLVCRLSAWILGGLDVNLETGGSSSVAS